MSEGRHNQLSSEATDAPCKRTNIVQGGRMAEVGTSPASKVAIYS